MYNVTALETKFLLFMKNSPPLSLKEIFAFFKNQQQAEKALEGCLAKNYITLTENQKYTITPEGKNQVYFFLDLRF